MTRIEDSNIFQTAYVSNEDTFTDVLVKQSVTESRKSARLKAKQKGVKLVYTPNYNDSITVYEHIVDVDQNIVGELIEEDFPILLMVGKRVVKLARSCTCSSIGRAGLL